MVRISRICKEDSFSPEFVSSQWRKIFMALRTKGWSDALLMIRLLFTVSVSNVLFILFFYLIHYLQSNKIE